MMKAMILSAGYGKRLNPLTLDCPKPLLKLGRETLLSNTIKFLEKFGVKDVVINVHYLGEQIIDYINKNNFNLTFKIIKEEKNILDTGGGVLNAIENFSKSPFIVINPDTIWNSNYLSELKLMQRKSISNKKSKCLMLVINKSKCFDKNFKGDFNLENDLIKKDTKGNLTFIYTGLQIIRPEVFSGLDSKIFSINKIWDKLIKNKELYGMESNIDFLHVSTLDVYKNLLDRKFKH